jgi:hypothetical protein
MTNKRNLKKDIHFITAEFIDDCYFTCTLSEDMTENSAEELVDTVWNAKDALIHAIHNPENKRARNINKDIELRKERRKNHKKVVQKAFDEFVQVVEDSYKKLSELSKLPM